MATVTPRLVMIGPASDSRTGLASLIEAYRAHGLFKRWPADYLATHGSHGWRKNVALTLAALRRLAELVFAERALLVHLHVGPGSGLWRDALFMALAYAARCPLILHLHGNALERLHEDSGRAVRAALRWVLEQAACVVVPSEFQRSWLRGVARHARVALIAPPVAPLEAPPEARRANLVLFLGRLEAAKGIFDLLEAVASVRPAVPDVRLLCAGEGDRDVVLRYAERLGIADAVKFTGWVGPSGKRAVLESAAVFALPSYGEGLPMSLLEAMAAGVPAVASAVGGVPEVMVDGVNGFLVAPGDTATLQRLLRKLLLDRALAARVGTAARASVALRCAPERALARLEDLYTELGLSAFGEAQAHKPAL